ncbi:MAG: PilN domain-containing protein [Deltaproteobacteria bacterium]|nr:PilN domain-containing protein [Deltaproteobacteria bacterium]
MTVNGINLIPDDIRRLWMIRRWKFYIWPLFACWAAALVLIYLGQRSDIAGKRKEAGFLAQEKGMLIAGSAQYALLSARFSDIQKTESELKNRLSLAKDLSDKRIAWSVVLKRLSHDIPQDVRLKGITTSDGDRQQKKVKFVGSAAAGKAVADFVFILENSGYFTDVELSYAQKRDFDSMTVYDFEILTALKVTDEVIYEW